MSDSSDAVEAARNQFEYPMLDPLSVPVQVDEDTLHIRGGPFTGPNLTIEDVEEEGLIGNLIEALDGETHIDDLFELFGEENQEELANAILELYEADAIRDGSHFSDWRTYEHKPIREEIATIADDRTRLDDQSLGIVNVGPIGEHVATAALQMGVGRVNFYQPLETAAADVPGGSDRFFQREATIEEAVEANDFVVYVADRRCSEFERRLDEHAYETKTPWIVGQFLGYDAFVGPGIFPDLTPCFNCFKTRTASHVSAPDGFRAYWDNEYSSPGRYQNREYQPINLTIAGILTHDLGNLLEYGVGYLAGRVIWMGLYNLDMSAHRVIKLPRCDVCGVDPGGQYNPLMKRDDIKALFGLSDQ